MRRRCLHETPPARNQRQQSVPVIHTYSTSFLRQHSRLLRYHSNVIPTAIPIQDDTHLSPRSKHAIINHCILVPYIDPRQYQSARPTNPFSPPTIQKGKDNDHDGETTPAHLNRQPRRTIRNNVPFRRARSAERAAHTHTHDTPIKLEPASMPQVHERVRALGGQGVQAMDQEAAGGQASGDPRRHGNGAVCA